MIIFLDFKGNIKSQQQIIFKYQVTTISDVSINKFIALNVAKYHK